MRWYLVVEGRQTEKKVYQAWLAHAFPEFEQASRIEDMTDNRYYLIVGGGYPSYLDRLQGAVQDIQGMSGAFDHLMVCIDAEELSAEQRREMIREILDDQECPVPYTVIVHDCCMETWFLGNAKLARRNPHSEKLRQYYGFFDVRTKDPEKMPSNHEGSTRAVFHLDYLREMFRERNITYSKRSPGETCTKPYLDQLIKRHEETQHLQSFGILLRCWRNFESCSLNRQPGSKTSHE